MKQRNILLALLFSILTCGIYTIYWFVKITNDSNTLAPKHATMGGVAAFFVGIFTFGIYDLYWAYRLGEKEGEMLNTSGSGVLYLILALFTLGIVPMCIGQNAINKALAAKAASAASSASQVA